MTTTPKAIELAETLEDLLHDWVCANEAADELRRLSALEQQGEDLQSDGWIQDGGLLYRLTDERNPANRDEIKVTMADGSRTVEACTRRAGELRDRIRSNPATDLTDKLVDALEYVLDRLVDRHETDAAAVNARAIIAKVKGV